MTKFACLFLMLILLAGCEGDRLVFREKGDASISKDLICIKSSVNDILQYYNLSSSVNGYAEPLVAESYIEKKFPDTCIKVDLKTGEEYALLYELNSEKYRLEFKVNKSGYVIKTIKG